MKLEDINEQTIQGVDDQELLSLHHRMHQLFAGNFSNDQEQAGNLTPELLIGLHNIMVGEMVSRGLVHDTSMVVTEDAYDVAYFKGMEEPDLTDYGDIIAIARNVVGQKVLDVGCGSGKVAKVLKSSGLDVTGVDSHPIAVQMAKQGGVNAELADATALPYPDNSFDTVFTNHVLEHVLQFKKAMAECVRVAKSRVIHIVPVGKCLDGTHVTAFLSVDEVRKQLAVPGVPRHVMPVGTFDQNACVIFYLDFATGHPILDNLDDFLVIPETSSRRSVNRPISSP
jgi:SAM-dependent methyltransferase